MTDLAADTGCLPPEVERLLLDVVADGFTVYCCGPKAKPTALVAVYEWPQCIDLITIHDFDRITAARAPKRGNVDIFAPEVVMWAYEGSPQWTLRVLLNLVHPHHPDAPHGEYPAPPCLHIPRAEQRPMTIRLPLPDRAGARARRLTTALEPLTAERVQSLQDGNHRRTAATNQAVDRRAVIPTTAHSRAMEFYKDQITASVSADSEKTDARTDR